MHATGHELRIAVELEAEYRYFITDRTQHGLAGDNLSGRRSFRALDADDDVDRKRFRYFAAAILEMKIDHIFAGRRTTAIAYFIVQVAGVAQMPPVVP